MRPRLLHGKRVLLVEDDEVNQMLLKIMIEDQGAEFTLEPDEKKARKKIQSENYDLILLDTRLENSNALQLAKDLRSEDGISTPIIGMSSIDLSGRGVYNGLNEVLLRPIEYQNFVKALERLLV